jgi:flagellar biosynthesis/type III secretory pathway M-ring protein FliF/YscJ
MPDNNNEACGICCLLLFMIVGVVWLWMTYPAAAIGLAIMILLVAVFGVQRWFKAKEAAAQAKNEAIRAEEERKRRREQFEQEQAARGLVRFVDEYGNEKWGTKEEVREWQQEQREQERLDKGLVVREKETVIREIVKVRCQYCGRLYEEMQEKCPHCGASR